MIQNGPILLIVLLIYIFAPSLFSWVADPSGGWYKPFIVWLIVIIIAYIVQRRAKSK